MKNSFSTASAAWLLLTLACIILIMAGLRLALRRTGWEKKQQNKMLLVAGAGISLWAILLLILSYNGFFENFNLMPPRPALALLIPLPLVLVFSFSKAGSHLLASIPSHWLIYMQSFRIAVELLLLRAFLDGKIPVQMSFEGSNFDILTGLLALPAGYLVARGSSYSRKLALGFNVIGIILLINILVIAVLSMPTPFRYFMNEPANTMVAYFPFILLPGVLVPIAYTLHIFSLRQLWLSRSVSISNPVQKTKSYG